jgi:glyoxylase-like metal-dependent hydrolase (beta-lactamase superfamily II)
MAKWQYTRGLHELGSGIYAWLQPNGSWGWSNAGLVVDGENALLVDTLFDLKLTREMLDAMRRVSAAAGAPGVVINTHANGDHCYGNELLPGAEIIASQKAALEMKEMPARKLAALTTLARAARAGGAPVLALAGLLEKLGLGGVAAFGLAGAYVARSFEPFEFRGITLTLPTRTFEGSLDILVGRRKVRLIEVGPAHTKGDVVVYLPQEKVLFTGDILFNEGHPLVWEGPVSNWLRACERILELDVQVVVPGHGPITDRQGVVRMRDYFVWLTTEGRTRFEAGVPLREAALDMARERYTDWIDRERLIVNLDCVYRELRGDHSTRNVIALFGEMSRLAGQLKP